MLHYPHVTDLVAASHGDMIAWVRNFQGARNIWIARGPAFQPHQITRYAKDDGQELTQLTFFPDGTRLLYVRGGDHEADQPAEGNLDPDPASSPEQPVTAIWSVPLTGGAPAEVVEGDFPAISARGELAYRKNGQVWTAALDGQGKPERLFFDRGEDSDLRWSPDGSRLAFVSHRGDHAFVGIFVSREAPILYLAPSSNYDLSPRWSPDGTRIAFVRRPGLGGPPEPILKQIPHPWSIWVANTADGSGRFVWRSPDTLEGSYPDLEGETNLQWAAGDRLVFLAYLDGWSHLYSIPASGGTALLLTPGAFTVGHVAESRDRRFMVYDANSGTTAADQDRRHLFRVPVDRAEARALTSGDTLQAQPVMADDDRVAFIFSSAQRPPTIGITPADGAGHISLIGAALPADFPLGRLVVPKAVTFQALDGTTIHGQLFEQEGRAPARSEAGVIFVHGGPERQMLLGWHYSEPYSNTYAVNQYLATHGFAVLSVNYRLGIGYGRSFQQPDHAGYAGASEYQDVLAGAHFLQALPTVDSRRIGIWGGSYGGYLTALALARNSDVFKAGVDMFGVHDWTRLMDRIARTPQIRYEQGDWDRAMQVAWTSSPDADLRGWRSPVLLIHGDDDRDVPFDQTIDLARRLEALHVAYEELVVPNEIHGFSRYVSWVRTDTATVEFLVRKLDVRQDRFSRSAPP